jgi:predicted PurR-regulated permease PerM
LRSSARCWRSSRWSCCCWKVHRCAQACWRCCHPSRAAWCLRIATDIRRAIVRYVFGDLLASVLAGVVTWPRAAFFPLLWALWVALVDFLPQVGGALAGIPTVLFAALRSPMDAIVLAVVFLAYEQPENHVLNPIVMSRTVRTSPLLIFVSVLSTASIGSWVEGAVGAFVAALLASRRKQPSRSWCGRSGSSRRLTQARSKSHRGSSGEIREHVGVDGVDAR